MRPDRTAVLTPPRPASASLVLRLALTSRPGGTENLRNQVSVHCANPSWFVVQKNRPETHRQATPAEGDGKHLFFVR